MKYEKKTKIRLYNDHFENAKRYNIPHAQLIIADIPYNLGNKAYASNPSWYINGDNKKGESKLAGKSFFDTDNDFKINNFFDFCTRYLNKEPKEEVEKDFDSEDYREYYDYAENIIDNELYDFEVESVTGVSNDI